MSKNKNKRKGKLSRPPKRNKPVAQPIAPASLDETHLREVESFLGDPHAHLRAPRLPENADQTLDLPHPDEFQLARRKNPGSSPASGSMAAPIRPRRSLTAHLPMSDPLGLLANLNPNLFASPRFVAYKSYCERIKASLPQDTEHFSAYQVVDPQLRKWLIRMTVRREKGLLRNWQVNMLAQIGYDWNRKKPRMIAQPKPNLFDSKLFLAFKSNCERTKAALPPDTEKFSVYQIVDPQLRRWLNRNAVRHEKGILQNWQVEMLAGIGFDWNRRIPRQKKEPRPYVDRTSLKLWMRKFHEWEQRLQAYPGAPIECLIEAPRQEQIWLFRHAHRALNKPDSNPQKRQLIESLGLPAEWFADMRSCPNPHWLFSLNRFLIAPASSTENADAADHQAASPNVKPIPVNRRWITLQRKAAAQGKLSGFQKACLEHWGFSKITYSTKLAVERLDEKLDTLAQLIQGKTALDPQVLAQHNIMCWFVSLNRKAQQHNLPPVVSESLATRGIQLPIKLIRPRRNNTEEDLEQWESMRKSLSDHFARFGELRFRVRFQEERHLANWLTQQRLRLGWGRLSQAQQQALLAIDPDIFTSPIRRNRFFQKKVRKGWCNKFEIVQSYLRKRGWERFPENGAALPREILDWLLIQKRSYESKLLSPEQLSRLETIGFSPQMLQNCTPFPDKPDFMEQGLERFKDFFRTHGHGKVTETYHDSKLVSFVVRIRKMHRMNLLTAEQHQALKEAGFIFDAFGEPSPAWLAQYRKLAAYQRERGHMSFTKTEPQFSDTADFIRQQKRRAKQGKLLQEHIRLLDELGIDWGKTRPIAKDAAK